MSATPAAPLDPDLLLVPLTVALARLRERRVSVRLLTPPYPCTGVGALRVVRVSELEYSTALDATYERYERRGARPARR